MANAVAEISGIEIANVAKISGKTDDNIVALGGREFTGVLDAHVLICEEIVSNVTSVTITAGITSTYDVYIFEFINIHPDTESTSSPPDGSGFGFQVDIGTATSYAQSITSMSIGATHSEDDSTVAELVPHGGFGTVDATYGQNKETALQWMTQPVNSDADSGVSGYLRLYGPSSSTYVKHFIGRTISMNASDYIDDFFLDGWVYNTSPVTRIKFAFDNGSDFDGTIRMYGMTKTVV